MKGMRGRGKGMDLQTIQKLLPQRCLIYIDYIDFLYQ